MEGYVDPLIPLSYPSHNPLIPLSYPSHTSLILPQARELLQGWSTEYFSMRKKIEDSGSDHRWEFDRKQVLAQY